MSSFILSGRGFTRGGQGGHQFNWPNVQRGRDFNKHGQTSRFERNYDHRYAEFHGRQSMERGYASVSTHPLPFPWLFVNYGICFRLHAAV